VAYCFLPEGAPEAKEWVKARLLKLLQGKVSTKPTNPTPKTTTRTQQATFDNFSIMFNVVIP
jgi:hypothetical protein